MFGINPCGVEYFPGGYAVLPGHVTSQNVSSLWRTVLVLTPGSGDACGGPPTTRGPIMFLPEGNQAVGTALDLSKPVAYSQVMPDRLNVTSALCTGEQGTVYVCAGSLELPGLVGYYSSSTNKTNTVRITPFSPGEYTIVAWDDWDQYVYVNFVVQPAASPL
jgi:hypothetical protein